MATTKLSAEERSYIVSGIVENFRADGRSRRDFRNFEFKKNVISNTNGSVQLQLVRLRTVPLSLECERNTTVAISDGIRY